MNMCAPLNVRIMGILNVTPDSFSDGGEFQRRDVAVAHGRLMFEQGATIIDVGGASTRPGARHVSVQEELDRVVPIVEGLAEETPVSISVDTSKPEVMRAAVMAGACMINDVRALRAEGALEAAADLGVPVCLMHMQGEPESMQVAPSYKDVVVEVRDFLLERVQLCEGNGISRDSVIIDPGFGFGKTLEHNLCLMAGLERFVATRIPVLVGVSRKSMIGSVLGRPVNERVAGSVALAVLAASKGAAILRAHDVAPTVDAIRMLEAVRGSQPGVDAD